MKKILITLTILSAISCKAQFPIIPLYNGSEYGSTQNAYYKDTNNDFDKFIGTWLYTDNSNNELFKIIIKKKELYYSTSSYDNISIYEDMLYGEFQYIDAQGNEIINSLSQIDNTSIQIYEHLIYGNDITNNEYPYCEECSPNERRVVLTVKDPQRSHLYYNIVIRYINNLISNEESIIIKIDTEEMNIMQEGLQNDDRLPFFKITLIKE